MATDLLQSFLDHEADDFIVGTILRELNEAIEKPRMDVVDWSFNLFDISIDMKEGTVLVEDTLDTSPAGSASYDLNLFITRLKDSKGPSWKKD